MSKLINNYHVVVIFAQVMQDKEIDLKYIQKVMY